MNIPLVLSPKTNHFKLILSVKSRWTIFFLCLDSDLPGSPFAFLIDKIKLAGPGLAKGNHERNIICDEIFPKYLCNLTSTPGRMNVSEEV